MAWLGTWAKRVKVTIDQTDITSALSNFPILIKLSVSCGRNSEDLTFIFTELGSNKLKMALTKDDGITQCYVEIEDWNYTGTPSTSVAWLHSKIPDIASGANTDLYLYYDSAQSDNTTYVGDPESAAAVNVWDSNFSMVQDMQDYDTSNIHDSTSNNKDGVKLGAGEPAEATGKIYKGQDFDGVDDYVEIGDTVKPTTAITVSAWVYHTLVSTQQAIVERSKGYAIRIRNTNKPVAVLQTTGKAWNFAAEGAADVPLNTWTHIAMTYVTGVNKLYINGAEVDEDTSYTGDLSYTAGEECNIGRSSIPPGIIEFDGVIDAVRISDTNRSAAWIKAEYETGIDDLLDFGTEEVLIIEITGTIAAQSGVTAVLKATKKVSGTIGAQSSLTGDIKLTLTITGTVDAISTALASTKVSRKVTGTISAISGLTADTKVARKVTGAIAVVSGTTAILKAIREIIGTIDGQSSMTGIIERISKITGAINATSDVSASIKITREITGSIDAQSGLSGTLTGGIIIILREPFEIVTDDPRLFIEVKSPSPIIEVTDPAPKIEVAT